MVSPACERRLGVFSGLRCLGIRCKRGLFFWRRCPPVRNSSRNNLSAPKIRAPASKVGYRHDCRSRWRASGPSASWPSGTTGGRPWTQATRRRGALCVRGFDSRVFCGSLWKRWCFWGLAWWDSLLGGECPLVRPQVQPRYWMARSTVLAEPAGQGAGLTDRLHEGRKASPAPPPSTTLKLPQQFTQFPRSPARRRTRSTRGKGLEQS